MSHPKQKPSDIQDAGGGYQPTALPPKSNRGAGTVEVENAADAQGNSSAKPEQTFADRVAFGTTGPNPVMQTTGVTTDLTPAGGSPTQNQRDPDGGVPVTAALGPTPK